MLHLGGEPYRRLGGKVLRGDGERKPDYTQTHEQAYHSDNVALVAVGYAVVDYRSDNERHEKLQESFKQLEQRPEYAFLFVFFNVNK